jgi:branched-chain amino acid transport system ATP-binding protein
VQFGEHRLDRMRPYEIAGIGVARAFQNIALSAGQSVAENLMLGRHHLTKAGFIAAGLRLPRATREGKVHGERVAEIAEFLELGDKLHTPVGVLSYGDQKRVEVARALCTEPRLLLLDEPVANLDPLWQLRLMEILRLAVRSGQGAVVAMHDLDLAARFADRLVLMDRGAIVADGEPGAVLASARLEAAFGIRKVDGEWCPLPSPDWKA